MFLVYRGTQWQTENDHMRGGRKTAGNTPVDRCSDANEVLTHRHGLSDTEDEMPQEGRLLSQETKTVTKVR
jgi:hypothetical protein